MYGIFPAAAAVEAWPAAASASASGGDLFLDPAAFCDLIFVMGHWGAGIVIDICVIVFSASEFHLLPPLLPLPPVDYHQQ